MSEEVTETPVATQPQGEGGVYMIPVTKAGNQLVRVSLEQLPDNSFRGVVATGLKTHINSGATKITQDGPDGKGYSPEAQAAAMKLAQEKVTALLSGKFKFGRQSGGADKGMPHKVVVEATRLARDAIKQLIRDSGQKVTHFKASEITAAAKSLLADERGKAYYDQAAENINKKETTNLSGFNLSIKPDPTLEKKAKEKGKLDVGQLSAAAASRTSTAKSALNTVKH